MKEHIKRELQRVLKNNTYERWEASSTGKLDPNKLGMAKVTDKVFKQKIPNTGRKYNVELLVDVSGSMYGGDLQTSMRVVQDIIAYFFGIIDVNITFFDVIETSLKGREILAIDVSNEECEYTFDNEITKVSINGKPQYIKTEEGEMGEKKSKWGNWEVCNLVSAWERIQKKEGEKVIIMLGDGAVSIDFTDQGSMMAENLHVSGQPVASYNKGTYKDVVDRIMKSGVPILPMCIGGNDYDRYFDNAVRLSRVEEAGSLILNFFNEHFNEK